MLTYLCNKAAISSKNIHLTAHLVAPNSNPDQLYQKALDVLKHNHSITEITLQIERDLLHKDFITI